MASPSRPRVIAAGTIGNLLEWYDFAIYGYFAASIGRVFGPIMIVWFVTIAALGIKGIVRNPAVLLAVNPMNAAGFPILSLITWLPLVGGVIIMSVRGDEATVASNARWTALWTSLIVLVLSIVLWVKFDTGESGFQFIEQIPWLPEYGVGYKMGVDGISVLFVLLSTLLTPICILSSWECITRSVRAGPPLRSRGSSFGTICHETPNLSLSHPHWPAQSVPSRSFDQ